MTNTCLAADTCGYVPTLGCFYGQSQSKNKDWAGAYAPRDGMSNCTAACSTTQKALYCVEQ